MEIRRVALEDLIEDPQNPRTHPAQNLRAIRDSLQRFGQVEPLVVRAGLGVVIGGNGRLQVMREMGWAEVDVVELELSDSQAAALGVALNRSGELAEWDPGILKNILGDLGETDLDIEAFALSDADLKAMVKQVTVPSSDSMSDRYTDPPQRMTEVFGAPPFTVWDGRKGYWQERKRAWFDLGIEGEVGRPDVGEELSGMYRSVNDGISVIDPVVCELLYAWFCPPGGVVVNPMAGESVYGIVAAMMGRPYVGIEIRQEQIDSNRAQAEAIQPPVMPEWILGDGRDTQELAPDTDFVICCPPYYDLEIYSDDERDLSTADSYQEFLDAYFAIATASAAVLKPDRFAAFIVGDIRDERGLYRNFVSDTITALQAAGLVLYNDAILLTPIGTLPFRSGKIFRAGRKLGKAHQNILIFVKGDPKAASEACGEVTRLDLETKGD
jgi:hypothetical protein